MIFQGFKQVLRDIQILPQDAKKVIAAMDRDIAFEILPALLPLKREPYFYTMPYESMNQAITFFNLSPLSSSVSPSDRSRVCSYMFDYGVTVAQAMSDLGLLKEGAKNELF